MMHVSFALLPGKFAVGCLLEAMGMSNSEIFPSCLSEPNKRVVLGPWFHEDLDFCDDLSGVNNTLRREEKACALSCMTSTFAPKLHGVLGCIPHSVPLAR